MRAFVVLAASLCSSLALPSTLPPAQQHGVDWLTAQVQSNGSIAGENYATATALQTREESLVTLALLAQVPSALVSKVAQNTDANAEYTARRVIASANANLSDTADSTALLGLQNADGGWGVTASYQSNPLDTSFVLQALRSADTAASDRVTAAFTYLVQHKLADGGWGVTDSSSVYVTSSVLAAASAWSAKNPDAASIASTAATWLAAARGAAVDFGNTFDNASALIALATQSTQSDVLPGLATALTSTQLSDGSWSDDPYLTALALRGLWLASQPPVNPTTGIVTGIVVDQATNQPLSGASIQLAQNAGITAVSASNGSFTLSSVPAAVYTMTVSHAGYTARSFNLQVVAGQTLSIGTVALAPQVTTASLTGVVKNNSGAALQGVLITVGNLSTSTDASGAYQVTGIAPGSATIKASLVNYQTVTATVTFAANTSYVFSPTLYPTNVTPPPTSLQGTVVDSNTNAPLVGATVALGNTTKLTDASGTFSFTSVTAGAFTLNVSAAGYQSTMLSGTTVAGLNDVGFVSLQPNAATTTLQGRVLDQQGSAIANALLLVANGPSAISDGNGAYQLAGISGTQLTITVSATGFIAQAFVLTIPAPGNYTQDFSLVGQDVNAVTLGALTVAPSSAAANTDVTVSTTLVNGGSMQFNGVLLLEVHDSANNIIGSGTLTDAFGFTMGAVTLQPGQSIGVLGRWNTGQFAPDNYQFEMRLVQPASITRSNPLGTLIQNQFATFTITPTTHFTGTVASNPPVVQAGVNQTVDVTAVVKNDGNLALAAQPMTLSIIDAKSNTVAFSTTANLDAIVVNGLLNLDFGNWLPSNGGNYQLVVTAADLTIGKITGTAYVGNVAQAEFTAVPDTVLAGTRTVHGNIHVAGVNPAQATITDPLAPLIKTAIQRAVTFNDDAARKWIEANRCSSCHIGNQAFIGGELTRQLSTYNAFDRNTILNNISSNQDADGGITVGDPYRRRRLGTLSFWALLSYHNLAEFPTIVKRAADWVVGTQQSNGQWVSDYNGGWFNDDTSMAMVNISSLRRADEFLKTNAIATVPTYKTQTILANPASSRSYMVVSSTGNIYLTDFSGSAVKLTTPDGTLLTQWTGFSDPRSIVERADGQVWVASTGGTFRLNSDGTKTLLATDSLEAMDLGPDGTVWATRWGDRTIYQLNAVGKAVAWLSNSPLSQPGHVYADTDGSLYVPDYNKFKIFHILPDKTATVAMEMVQGDDYSGDANGHLIQLMRDGDHWLLSTTNGIFRVSSAWESQRITWSRADQMARLGDGSVVYVAYQQSGVHRLVPQTEDVAPSLPKYENALSRGTIWLQGRSYANAQGTGTSDNLHTAQQLWGLGEAYRFYATTDTARATTIQTQMTKLAGWLRANQRADGGWGNYVGNTSDALVTAQVGIALDYLNPSASDPAIRKAVTWLLTQQQGDGSWISADGIMSTHESTTTMVAIWLPMILDRLGAIDAQVAATFPQNVQTSQIAPTPDQISVDANGNTTATWKLIGVTDTGRDLDFDLTLENMLPNETRAVATDAHMTFDNSFSDTTVTVPITIPSVTATAPVSLSVATDQPAYPHNATAQVTTTLVNMDDVEVDGTVLVNVYDANGVLVGTVNSNQPVALPASGSLPVTGPFAIGTIVPATYTVKAVLSNAGGMLAQGQASFDVLPDNTTGTATSTLHTDKQVYNPSDQVNILSGVQSLSSNAILTNLTLNLQVVDASGTQQFTHNIAIAQLLASQTLNFTTPQQLTNAAPGVYTVKQDLLDANGNLFNHVETTYTVSSTGDTGFGLTGTIAATPKSLPVGATLTLNASATDQGNSALNNLPLTITIVDPNGSSLQQFTQTSTLAVGATVPFNTSWVTQGNTGVTYTAVLSATVGSGSTSKTLVLATDTFTLTLSLKANVTLTAASPPLAALVLMDANAPTSETARVNAALTALGYASTVVSTPADFANGVRTGAYQLYLLLATQVQPDATTQRLLREAVHRGEGLIVANGVAGLPDAIAQITGLQASNALPVINAQAIDVLSTAPGGAAHVDLNPSLASRIVVPQSAQTQATLTGRLPTTPDQGTLSNEVAALGRVDIGYFGVDAGTNGSKLSLTSLGRIHNADGTDHYSVWLIRNSGDVARSVVLASTSGGYSNTLAITSHTDTFIASPIVANTADHRLSENGTMIQSAPALTTVFADTRTVDVGTNPGAIALWANHIGISDALDWTGGQEQVHGAVHSNSDIRLSGAQNLLDGPVHYVTGFTNTGSQNTFTYPPRQVTAQPLPTLLNLDDFQPGGAVAKTVQYFDQTAECASSSHGWQRNASQLPLASGVYWIPCDVHINGGNGTTSNVTLVSTGAMQIDGIKGIFQPYYQGIQFATMSNSGSAIQLSGDSTQVGGVVFAPNGTVQVNGSTLSLACSVIGDQIRFANAKTVIDARQCPYATVQERTPAALWNTFGAGWTAYSAFDWQGAIGQYEATPSTLTNLFAGVLSHIAPTGNPLRAGTIVPLAATVQNQGDPFSGTLKVAANDDSTFVPPTTTWLLNFTPQTTTFNAQSNVRLGSGTSTALTATVASQTPVIMDPLKQTSTTIAHLSGETITDLIAAISAISTPDAGLNSALVDLQQAQVSLTANDRAGELIHLLDAAEACGQSTNTQSDALRTRIDWLIWASTH